ncbi:MAG TPA: Lar family restriction alleviation protein [Candidatus Dormibacteraeota bacterium]|nr:Lar family restriction alleviation protein [Candidatus Dormibacteraeota bacterium]
MADVIRIGASKREIPEVCPFCGADPGLAQMIFGTFIVGCDEEDCPSNPQTSGKTLNEAWAKWNTRK